MVNSALGGSSAIAWPWAWVIVVLAVIGIGLFAWNRARRRPRPESGAVWVAHSAAVRELPGYTALMRRYRVLRVGAVAAIAVAIVGTGALVARPVHTETFSNRLASRDIVLCLDVSGSMLPYDTQVLNSFRSLTKEFRGERVALSVFNSTSRTVFPLTDDYDLIQQELAEGASALDVDIDNYESLPLAEQKRLVSFLSGTMANPKAASLIGDGLANCALQFDEKDSKRSRSIILATDNEVSGKPIYTLPQAGELVKDRDITLEGLYVASLLANPSNKTEYQNVVSANGGQFLTATDPGSMRKIVEDVLAQQAVELGAKPHVVVTDRPAGWFIVVLLAVAALIVVGWRVRE